LGASVGAQWFGDIHGTADDDDGWAAELNVVWTPVENFTVRTEVVYVDEGLTSNDDGAVSGFVRFSRFF
jgi:hypothetical protein